MIASAVLGFSQEYRSEKAVEELKKVTAPIATVVRDGKEIKVLLLFVFFSNMPWLRETHLLTARTPTVYRYGCNGINYRHFGEFF